MVDVGSLKCHARVAKTCRVRRFSWTECKKKKKKDRQDDGVEISWREDEYRGRRHKRKGRLMESM
jgi:hypothetical protein